MVCCIRRLIDSLILAAALSAAVEAFSTSRNAACIQSITSKFTNRQRAVSRSNARSATQLSMHFGHSHSHHRHDDHSHNHNHKHDQTETKSWREHLVGFIPKRRESGRIAFAALTTLLPALIVRRRCRQVDWILFILTSAVLTLSDTIRKQAFIMVRKFQALTSGIQKHSPRGGGIRGAADQVTFLSVIVNVLLSVSKFAVGVTARSSALVADAAHSLSDLISDGITLWAVQLGRLPPDEDHPYGHGKFEAIGSLFLALTLVGTGVGVGMASYNALFAVLFGSTSELPQPPSQPALVMALISILSKEWLYRITKRVGDSINSQVLIANAWHHRSDAYSSILALASIGLARMGWLAADAAAGLLVGGMIGLTGFEILGESIKQLTDTNESQLADRVTSLIQTDSDVGEIASIRARQLGSSAWVDVDLTTRAKGMSASALRTLEERLRWKIMTSIESVQVMVHATEGSCAITSSNLDFASSDDHHDHSHDHDSSSTSTEGQGVQKFLTVQQVQNEVQKRLPAVVTPSVVVKYDEQNTVHVDVVVLIPDVNGMTITEAQERSHSWKLALERSPLIDKAMLFLDLNAQENPMTATSPKQFKVEGDGSLESLG